MPPLQRMRFALKAYGKASGQGHRGDAMLWIMEDQRAVLVQNAHGEPDGVRRIEYPVEKVTVTSFGVMVAIPGQDEALALVQAPCVCGAGPTATALPEPMLEGHRLDLQTVDTMPEWVVRG